MFDGIYFTYIGVTVVKRHMGESGSGAGTINNCKRNF